MKIEVSPIQALYTVEWPLPMLPLVGDTFLDSQRTKFRVHALEEEGRVVLQGVQPPYKWVDPCDDHWAERVFNHRLADLLAIVEAWDFKVDGVSIPDDQVLTELGYFGHLVMHGIPVSILPRDIILSVHVLFSPYEGVHGDFSGADFRGKSFDRLDLTLSPDKGLLTATEHGVKIDTKILKTTVWQPSFTDAIREGLRMALAIANDQPVTFDIRVAPSGG